MILHCCQKCAGSLPAWHSQAGIPELFDTVSNAECHYLYYNNYFD